MRDFKIVYRDPRQLVPYPRNVRVHSDEQITKLAGMIRRFGFNVPILLRDINGTIGAGHARRLAAIRILDSGETMHGRVDVPTICLTGLSDAEWRAFAIADNRIALDSTWNIGDLKSELEAIQDSDCDLDLVGFSADELSAFGLGDATAPASLDEFPEFDEKLGTQNECPKCMYRW